VNLDTLLMPRTYVRGTTCVSRSLNRAPVQARYVAADVDIHGTNIPEGSVLLLLTGVASRDERKFDDPDRLDVGCTIDHHVHLGTGCISVWVPRWPGSKVAGLEEVLARLPSWEVAEEHAERVHTSTVGLAPTAGPRVRPQRVSYQRLRRSVCWPEAKCCDPSNNDFESLSSPISTRPDRARAAN
jgi:hypothetical protein